MKGDSTQSVHCINMKKSQMTVLEKCFRKAAKQHGIKLKKKLVADLGYILQGKLDKIKLEYKIQKKKSEKQSPEEKRVRADIRYMLGISEPEINKKNKQKTNFSIEQINISKNFPTDGLDSDRFWITTNPDMQYYSVLSVEQFNKRYAISLKSKVIKEIHDAINALGLSGAGMGMSISDKIDLSASKKVLEYMNEIIDFLKGCATA